MQRCSFWVLTCLFHLVLIDPLSAEVRLPRLVGDHMVLQRGIKIPIWGWADAGETVTITLADKRYATKAGADRKWTLALPEMIAGGPYILTVRGRTNTLVVQDILIGDVWVGSGQSNMEWHMHQLGEYVKQDTETATFPAIRLINVNDTIALVPQDDIRTKGWRVCSPQTVGDFSAVAFFFARNLYQQYNVPIGLIMADWGGTPIESWMSLAALKTFPEFVPKVRALESNPTGDKARLTAAFSQQLADWQATYTAGDKGFVNHQPVWAVPNLNTVNWPAMSLPTHWEKPGLLPDFDGVVWFRKELMVDEADAGKPITLRLGRIDDVDSTWFNGLKIGGSSPWNALRIYNVPGNLIKVGRNVIAIRVLDTGSDGGVRGIPEEMTATIGDKTVSLAGQWAYQIGIDTRGSPQAPGLIFAQNSLGSLFNGMITPLIPYGIKGVIWYQGENNVDKAHQYRQTFPALIQDWRQRWGYAFPFLFVQLTAFMPDKDEPADYAWAELREAQALTLSVPKTGMAVTTDIGDPTNIHPVNKQDVGKRLALEARRVAYNDLDVVSVGPAYKSMTVSGKQVRLQFNQLGGGLLVEDRYGYVKGFAVAGADRRFRWAKAYQEGNELVLASDEVAAPVAVRYNWGNSPDGNLFNREGLPAVPFRTDDWPGLTFGKK